MKKIEKIARLLVIANELTVEHMRVPMTGTLQVPKTEGKYVILKVPTVVADNVFETIKTPEMQRPPDYAPHISVMTSDEYDKIRDKVIEHNGEEFQFFIDDLVSVEPEGWPEMEKCYFIRCHSPQLEDLRKECGLTSLIKGDHPFHITIAVVPKKDISKILERS